MEIKAMVKYRGRFAEYRIGQESEGIYFASMVHYEGGTVTPPDQLLLTRGVRHWKGSSDEQPLIDELGEVIDINLKSGIVFRQADGSKDTVGE